MGRLILTQICLTKVCVFFSLWNTIVSYRFALKWPSYPNGHHWINVVFCGHVTACANLLHVFDFRFGLLRHITWEHFGLHTKKKPKVPVGFKNKRINLQLSSLYLMAIWNRDFFFFSTQLGFEFCFFNLVRSSKSCAFFESSLKVYCMVHSVFV